MKGDLMNQREYPCEFCDTDQEQEQKLVTVARNRGQKWYIFEDVQAWVCPNCGHRYFDAPVVSAMEAGMQSIPADARPVEAYAIRLPVTR
jgi:YgiT-type zinc finger domain-containing protein